MIRRTFVSFRICAIATRTAYTNARGEHLRVRNQRNAPLVPLRDKNASSHKRLYPLPEKTGEFNRFDIYFVAKQSQVFDKCQLIVISRIGKIDLFHFLGSLGRSFFLAVDSRSRVRIDFKLEITAFIVD